MPAIPSMSRRFANCLDCRDESSLDSKCYTPSRNYSYMVHASYQMTFKASSSLFQRTNLSLLGLSFFARPNSPNSFLASYNSFSSLRLGVLCERYSFTNFRIFSFVSFAKNEDLPLCFSMGGCCYQNQSIRK
jgi:hypothetical protein